MLLRSLGSRVNQAGGAGKNRGLLSGVFSPAALFASGSQGFWYDPSDFSTMFQDSAGTTPVTAVEQPVGLILDKSQGLEVGNELVSNGDFSDGSTGWTNASIGTGTFSVAGSAATLTGTDGSNRGALRQAITCVVGRTYRVTAAVAGAQLNIAVGSATTLDGTGGVAVTNIGAVTFVVVASATTMYVKAWNIASGGTATIDNISVRELPGNHASQSTSASRPVLSAKVNEVLNSRLNGGVSGSPGTAPTSWSYANVGTPAYTYGTDSEANGSTVRIVQDTTQRSIVRQNVSVLANNTYIMSAVVDVTTGASVWQHISAVSLPSGATLTHQLDGATVAGSTAMPTGRHIIAAVVAASSTAGAPEFRFGAGLQGAGTACDITFRQVQIESGSTRTNYQWTNTSTDYDTTGFPYYLRADGVDDRLIGPAISNIISASEYEACVGARLLLTTTNNASPWVNNSLIADSAGYFGIGYATTANVLGAFNFDGTSDAATLTITPPSTFVLQQRHSGGSLGISTNGDTEVTVASGNTSVLTGDLRLFSSNGSPSVYARLYGAIGRNTAFTPSERASVLAWVNSKTRAF